MFANTFVCLLSNSLAMTRMLGKVLFFQKKIDKDKAIFPDRKSR